MPLPQYIPIVGSVSAGSPDDWLPSRGLRELLRPLSSIRQLVAWRVVGDSMSGDRIFDGDWVIVELTDQYRRDDILLVSTPSGICIKRVRADGETVTLCSSNPAFRDQVWASHDVRLMGVVRRVERDL